MILTPEQVEDYLKRHGGQGVSDREVTSLLDTLADSERRRKIAEKALSILAGGEQYRREGLDSPESDLEIAEWEGWGPTMAYAIAESEQAEEATDATD